MKDIIVKLLAIYHYAKDIHYQAHGDNFYAIHLLMDQICENIHDQIDAINEVGYLGMAKDAPHSADVLKVAQATIPEIEEDGWRNLSNLAFLIIDTIDSISNADVGEISGVQSLLDDIQKTLLQKRGLLARTVNLKMSSI